MHEVHMKLLCGLCTFHEVIIKIPKRSKTEHLMIDFLMAVNYHMLRREDENLWLVFFRQS